ncbi:MAG TPA: DMT family transporter [Bryobacteraceae bacterium]|nr:DMT family transporter [Bryobacteraceae bacterium]
MSAAATPSQIESPARWKADLALAATALIWGTTFVVVKHAVASMSTMYFLALRFGFASLCTAILFRPAFRRAASHPDQRRQLAAGLGYGALTGVLLWGGYAFQTDGLKYTSAGNSGFLTGFYIVLVPLLSAAIYRRWPRLIEFTGVLIATGGMVVLTLPSISTGFRMNRGDVLTIACAVCYSFHLLTLGHFSKRYSFEPLALGQLAATAVLSALALFVEPPVAHWNPSLLAAILGTGFFATTLTFALQTWGQRYTTATRAALIFSLEPVFALATAVLIGGEMLTRYSVIGGCLILSGILLVELKTPAAGERPEPAE